MPADDKKPRNRLWRDIWALKYGTARGQPLHVLSGWDALTPEQWQAKIESILSWIRVPASADVLDVGCGAGAFLRHLPETKSITAVDYSLEALRIAREYTVAKYCCASALSLPFRENVFDVVLSHSLLNYLNDEGDASRLLTEVLYVLRGDGIAYVGDVNDSDKQDLYREIRGREDRERLHLSNTVVDQLFLPKAFFRDFCSMRALDLQIIDEEWFGIPFYSGARYRYAVLIRRR